MRTQQQIQRKLSELKARQTLLAGQRNAESAADGPHPLDEQLGRLEESILLLEWVLDAPAGSYHM